MLSSPGCPAHSLLRTRSSEDIDGHCPRSVVDRVSCGRGISHPENPSGAPDVCAPGVQTDALGSGLRSGHRRLHCFAHGLRPHPQGGAAPPPALMLSRGGGWGREEGAAPPGCLLSEVTGVAPRDPMHAHLPASTRCCGCARNPHQRSFAHGTVRGPAWLVVLRCAEGVRPQEPCAPLTWL